MIIFKCIVSKGLRMIVFELIIFLYYNVKNSYMMFKTNLNFINDILAGTLVSLCK